MPAPVFCPVFCRPQPGVREWLDTLGRFNVPCALVSALDRQTVQVGQTSDSHPYDSSMILSL